MNIIRSLLTHKMTLRFGIVAIIILVAATAYSFLTTDAKVRSYNTAYKEWSGSEKTELVASISKVPSNLYISDFDYSEKSFQLTNKACQTLEKTSKEFFNNSRVPSLDYAFLGTLKSSYREAKSQSDSRIKKYNQLVDRSGEAYRRMVADCQWSRLTNQSLRELPNYNKRIDDLYTTNGEVTENFECNKPRCKPAEESDRKAYAEAISAKSDYLRAGVTTAYDDKACETSSYGDRCQQAKDLLIKNYDAFEAYELDYASSFHRSPDSQAKYDDLVKTQNDFKAFTIKLYGELFNGAQVPSELEKDQETDTLLSSVANRRMDELARLANSI